MKPAEGSTVIGKSVVVRGDISGQEDLYLDCDIEGTITLSDNRLTIGPEARIVADVTVRDLVVFGKLTGNVHATGRVDLRQSASLTGDIVAGRLSIEESAVLKGRVELKPGTSQSASAPQTASAPAAVSPETLVLQSKA
jgi:cytoskeletal protein CcmA (bactofilin family)